jgi:osmotically-inducible protein OsmY
MLSSRAAARPSEKYRSEDTTMALRDLFRGGRHERDHERERYPLDPLSRDSWRDEAEARYGARSYRDFDDERRDYNDRWENSYSGPGYGRFGQGQDESERRDFERQSFSEQRSGQDRYGQDRYGGSGNPFYGDRPLMNAGSSYDSGSYFGSIYGLPKTPWRGGSAHTDEDDLVYGGEVAGDMTGERRSQYARGPHRGRGPRGYRRSDERIKEDVCQCLTDDPYIDASNIEVAVNDREVLLSGSVTSRMQKRHAEDLIESLPGVRDVINGLKVESPVEGQVEQSQSSAAQSTATQSSRRGGTFR